MYCVKFQVGPFGCPHGTGDQPSAYTAGFPFSPTRSVPRMSGRHGLPCPNLLMLLFPSRWRKLSSSQSILDKMTLNIAKSKETALEAEKDHSAIIMSAESSSKSSADTCSSENLDRQNAVRVVSTPSQSDRHSMNHSMKLKGPSVNDLEAKAVDEKGTPDEEEDPETPKARRIAIGIALALTMFVVCVNYYPGLDRS